MIDLKEFRIKNGLTQSELGDYIGIKKSFISRIERGTVKLPNDKFQKLLKNPYGWDTSMLTDMNHTGDNNVHAQVNGNGTANANINYGSGECAVLRERIRHLENLLDEKDKLLDEKERLIGILLNNK